jgi:hypothetical protein
MVKASCKNAAQNIYFGKKQLFIFCSICVAEMYINAFLITINIIKVYHCGYNIKRLSLKEDKWVQKGWNSGIALDYSMKGLVE